MKKIIIGLLIASFISIVTASSSFACSCMMPEDPETSLEKASKVFVGTVKEISDHDPEGQHFDVEIHFDVETNLKATDTDSITVKTASNGALCGINFVKGEKYIVYTYSGEDNIERTGLCSRTKNVKYADEDIKALIKKSYDSQEAFEKAEGNTCEVATDDCNTYQLMNGKIAMGTLKYCIDHTEKWSCMKEKSETTEKTYTTKEEFIKAEGDSCETATDGVNNFFGENFEFSTRMGYPENFVAEWKCVKQKEENLILGGDTDAHGCKGSAGYTGSKEKQMCVRPWEEEPKICTMEYAPVCGVDGVTYGNKCGAGDTKILHDGECKGPAYEIKIKKEVDKIMLKYIHKLEKFSIEKQKKINKRVRKRVKVLKEKKANANANEKIKFLIQYLQESLEKIQL